MKQWDIVKVAQAINSVPECVILEYSPAEDYVTKGFRVSTGTDYHLYIRGFRTDSISPSKDNDKVEMVEVSTGYCDGDMPNDPVYVVIHARVKAAIMQLGYQVVNSLEPYF